MNFISLISMLNKPLKVEQFLRENYPEIDFEDVDIYFKETISIEAEMLFCDCRQSTRLKMLIDGCLYINLFPLSYLMDIYPDYCQPSLTDKEIAEKIILFRINDA